MDLKQHWEGLPYLRAKREMVIPHMFGRSSPSIPVQAFWKNTRLYDIK